MDNLNNEERKIFNKVLNKVQEPYLKYKKITKGVHSNVFLLNDKFIIKFNDDITIKGEKTFFEKNINEYNEKIILYDNVDYKYIVYKYIENNEFDMSKVDITELKKQIKNYILSYKECKWEGYGYLFEEQETWKNFFEYEMNWRKEYALKLLSKDEYSKVQKAMQIIGEYKFKQVILHGDLGVHNLLFLNNELTGIIDPQPVAGDRMYDYIFFIFSDTRICNNIKLEEIYQDFTNEPIKKIKALIILILFDRIIRCVRHNLPEITTYIDLWKKFSNIL